MTNNEYNDVQRLIDSQTLAAETYRVAAIKIVEELDARGFTAEDSLQAVGLVDKIKDIILETVCGNTSYCVATNEEPTGMEGDLTN